MIFIMAWRNVWRNKMRSMLIMLSIVVGLFSGIAVLSLYKGMIKSRIRIVINAEVGHLQIHNPNFKKDNAPQFIIANGAQLWKAIHSIPQVKMVATRSITNAMLATATGSTGVQINGIIPPQEYEVSLLKKKIVEGKPFDPSRRNEVMVGKKLATKMKLKVGSKLVLTFTDVADNMVSGAFRVAAIYQSNNAPLDEKNVYVNQADLNSLLNLEASFHEIVILLKDDQDVIRIQQDLKRRFPAYQIESWLEVSPETDLMAKTVDQYSYIIMVIIMFALAFGIINTMMMAILERTREIGMMMALGTTKLKIFMLILLETLFLTLLGTPIGVFIAWLVVNYFHKQGLYLYGMAKEMMSSFGFESMIYPEFPADKLISVLLIVIGTALISCLFPAMKALSLRPVEALRR